MTMGQVFAGTRLTQTLIGWVWLTVNVFKTSLGDEIDTHNRFELSMNIISMDTHYQKSYTTYVIHGN